jgi:hypothetical protein
LQAWSPEFKYWLHRNKRKYSKLSFKIEGGIKDFQDKQKLNIWPINWYYERFWKESYTQKMKINIVLNGWELLNLKIQ